MLKLLVRIDSLFACHRIYMPALNFQPRGIAGSSAIYYIDGYKHDKYWFHRPRHHGKPMAGHLIEGGHALFLHSRSGVPEELLEQGGRGLFFAREVAQNADIIITMLPDTPDVERVLFGENWQLAAWA